MKQEISINITPEYNEILQQAVAVIEDARYKGARALVSTSNEMHWRIGKLLYERKLSSHHGDGVVKQLSSDLKKTYPKMGLSVRNLFNMKRFYHKFHKSPLKVQQLVALLPWGHISYLMTKFEDNESAIEYYASKYIEKKLVPRLAHQCGQDGDAQTNTREKHF